MKKKNGRKKAPRKRRPIKPSKPQALFSVYYKDGLENLARATAAVGWQNVSTGGTADVLEEAEIKYRTVKSITRFPEMLNGRVKTLHPNIYAAILAKLSKDHQAELDARGIGRTKLVCINLYPVWEALAIPGVSLAEVMELVDIGGVALIRAAAKNANNGVTVLCDPADYKCVIAMLEKDGKISEKLRLELARKAFRMTKRYDGLIEEWLAEQEGEPIKNMYLENGKPTRYGQNPHQSGCMFENPDDCSGDPLTIPNFRQLNGKAMSYTNFLDLDGAIRAVAQMCQAMKATTGKSPHVAAGMKHTNAAGAAVGFSSDPSDVTRKMLAGDPLAIFGGVVATTYTITREIAEILLDTARTDPMCYGKDRFLEVIAAPAFTQQAIELLRQKGNLRLMVNEALAEPTIAEGENMVSIRGAVLVEGRNTAVVTSETWEEADTGYVFTESGKLAGILAQAICQVSKSNTITLARCSDDLQLVWLVGNGTGQQSRVACCELAIKIAGAEAEDAVGASDAFFPAEDGPQTLIDAGVAGCISLSGSIAQARVVATCKKGKFVLALHQKRGFFH